jgi:hypothetical protein
MSAVEELKINCGCGSVVLKKNLASHCKTKKHLAMSGNVPPLPCSTGASRSRESSKFNRAQKSTVADAYANGVDEKEEEDDEYEDELEHGDDDGDDEFEDEVIEMLECLAERLVTLSEKLDACFERIEETRLKVNQCLGECREVTANQPYAKQINEMAEVLKTLVPTHVPSVELRSSPPSNA